MENQNNEQKSNQQQVKNAMAYIPVVAFVLYFTEEKKSVQFLRHIRYWMILFGLFIVLTVFLRSVFLWILVLAYVWISAFLAYKAYIWEDLRFKFVDDFFEKEKKEDKKKEEEIVVEEEIDVLK